MCGDWPKSHHTYAIPFCISKHQYHIHVLHNRLPFYFLFCFVQSVFWFAEFLLSECLFGNSLNDSNRPYWMNWNKYKCPRPVLMYYTRFQKPPFIQSHYAIRWSLTHRQAFSEHFYRLLHVRWLWYDYQSNRFFCFNLILLQVHCILSMIKIWMEYIFYQLRQWMNWRWCIRTAHSLT